MQRTISAMVGKGSVNHNSRKFRAENVDGTRTHLNIDYCNENIKTVYHELFDEALERYNAKQIRSDRKIKDYYEKIRSSKQEKPFHEIILQVGGKGNMNADTENGELAKQILDEYYQGFQERNPQLRVFSAHLHMDEATPVDYLDKTGDKEERTRIRTYLGSLKYTPDEMEHPIRELSGGQKAKVLLLRMSLSGANVLILDEPTRNFSPLSGPVIRKMLREFPGAVISISHDRKYIEEVCDKIYQLNPNGLQLIGD